MTATKFPGTAGQQLFAVVAAAAAGVVLLGIVLPFTSHSIFWHPFALLAVCLSVGADFRFRLHASHCFLSIVVFYYPDAHVSSILLRDSHFAL